jgi:hypothetical protein
MPEKPKKPANPVPKKESPLGPKKSDRGKLDIQTNKGD